MLLLSNCSSQTYFPNHLTWSSRTLESCQKGMLYIHHILGPTSLLSALISGDMILHLHITYEPQIAFTTYNILLFLYTYTVDYFAGFVEPSPL